jgi:hypothetical protein
LIVSQYGQSSRRPHRTCPRSPQSPPQAPRALGESTPEGAPPSAASLLPEPDSPLAVRPSHAAQSRGDGRSPGQQLAVIPHSEKAGMKPPYVCPGCSNHTHGNNMINRCNVINK